VNDQLTEKWHGARHVLHEHSSTQARE